MINSVVLSGRLVAKPELKTTNNDKNVCNFRIAVNDGFGENQKTYFVNVVAWNKLAEFLCKYGDKGNKIAVCGKYTDRTYDKNGVETRIVEIVATSADLLAPKNETAKTNDDFENVEFGDLPF